ncbi:hypothetical protein [Leptospira brenneri]|uniref:SH3 domain-containing protein n=1 Tax=Leptospira brenneri TaxID=2023182 RepID=A0A2M9XZS2_9LEPT|nr:hypothetical protein [Leptospira brenneri]PJZ44834.1 hypothetical protein CH361_14440 [Leptospira brenneri]TGK97080.1 hypothetical protein EHQ30_10965 [Leptospira brenneri]
MKPKFYISCILLLISCNIHPKEGIQGLKYYNAITTASSLRCREDTNTNSKIIQKFPFGTLISFQTEKPPQELKKESWIKVQNQNCFVSAEYLVFDKTQGSEFTKLDPEEYKCVPTEDIKDLPYYLIGDLYIHLIYEPLGNEHSQTNLVIEIGNLNFNDREIHFTNLKSGKFNPLGEWVGESQTKNVSVLLETTENNSIYYKNKNSKYNKTEAIHKCKELENKPVSLNHLNDVPWETFYNPKPISLEKIGIEMDQFRKQKTKAK